MGTEAWKSRSFLESTLENKKMVRGPMVVVPRVFEVTTDHHYFQKCDSRCVTDSLRALKLDFPLTRQRSRLFFVQILIQIDEQQMSKN